MAKTIQSLSAEQKAKLIRLYEENYISIKELAEKYKLSYYTLRNYMVNQKSLVASKPRLTTEKAYNIKSYVNEEWKKIKLPTNYYYEISNFGRIISYGNNNVPYLINGSSKMGYQTFCYTDNETGKRTSQFVHRLVAMNFVKKSSAKEKVVIHIDGNKANNKAKNLKWATISEAGLHGTNLKSKDENAKERAANITRGKKLTLAKVEMIRKILANPARTTRRKTIAKQFGISEMTLYRIQNGDLWGNKGTGAVVEKSVQKILSDDVVKMIKKMLKEGKYSQAQIAKNIGISETVISRIKQKKTYANI